MVVNAKTTQNTGIGFVIVGVIISTYSLIPCLSMTITAFGQCNDITRLMPGTSVLEDRMSLHQCVQRCATRPACVLISHARLYQACSLFDSLFHLPTTDGLPKDCVFISKEDFDAKNKQVVHIHARFGKEPCKIFRLFGLTINVSEKLIKF